MKTIALYLSIVLITLGLAPAQHGPTPGNVRIDGDVRLQANGDGVGKIVIKFSPADYTRIKSQNPNAHRFLRDFTSRRSDYEVAPGASARYEDAQSSVILELTERGALRNQGMGLWELPIQRGVDFVNIATSQAGTITAFFVETGEWAGGISYKGQVRYHLPAGARDARWNAGGRTLQYTLDRAEPVGAPMLTQGLATKNRLMTAIYKVYGLGTDFAAMWVAKSVLKNDGASIIKNLKIRFRLEGYSQWGVWQQFPELVPGQTVVANYYPVLDRSIATLTSNTPANLLVEWEYAGADGQTVRRSDGRRIILLGRHEFVFTDILGDETFGTWHESHANDPFVAAWVSRDDRVVADFAAMANRRAGGVGASTDDKSAVKVLGEIYRLMQVNDFTYQHPAFLVDQSISYDVKAVQSVQFPRDTIRKRSGTCIDLAILYAACANAIGIESHLALVPGHCFPVFKLPSGRWIGIESTGVGGGLRHGTTLFDSVLTSGTKSLGKWTKDGRINLLNLRKLWTSGVSNPEMERLPADILQKWKIVEHVNGEERLYRVNQNRNGGGGAGGGGNGGGGHRPTPTPTPTPVPTPAPNPTPPPAPTFTGTWSGQITEQLPNGQVLTYPATVSFTPNGAGRYTVTASAQATLPDGFGGYVKVRIVESGTATVRGSVLDVSCTSKTATYVGTGLSEPMTPDQGKLSILNGRLQGRWGNDLDGWVMISFIKS